MGADAEAAALAASLREEPEERFPGAVADALAPFGGDVDRLPLAPELVLGIIQSATS